MSLELPKALRAVWKMQSLPSDDPTTLKKTLAQKRAQARRACQEQLLGTLGQNHPGFLNGQDPVPALPLKEVDRLLRAGTKGLDPTAFRKTYNFGVAGLAEGVQRGLWKLEVPRFAREVRPPRYNLSPDDWLSLPALAKIREALLEAVTDPEFYEASENPYLARALARMPRQSRHISASTIVAGATMLSAIVNGALVAGPASVAGFVDALARGPVVDRGMLWMNLVITQPKRRSAPEEDSNLFRRYFPDPLTCLLILRFQSMASKAKSPPLPFPARLLEYVMASLDMELERQPRLRGLQRVAIQHFTQRLPSIILDYARDLHSARSLPESAWIRLRHDRLCAPRQHERADEEPLLEVIATPEISLGNVKEQRRQYFQLLRAINRITKRGRLVRKDFHELAALRASGSLCPLLALITHWCEYRMSPPEGGRKRIRTRSVKTYLSAFGKRLITFGYDFSVKEADTEAYIDLYERVIASVRDPRLRPRVRLTLQDFHNYLVTAQVAPPVKIDVEAHGASVDNNLVTRKEYEWARRALAARHNESRRHKNAQVLILTLGFRAGLRRSEVKYLRLRDLQVLRTKDRSRIREVELFIEPHRGRDLKSASARRRLPLTLLLPAQELEELVDFFDAQCTLHHWPERNPDALLFSDIGNPGSPLDDEYTFDPITLALQTASGDERARVHHPRHSFGNRLLMYLEMARHPEIITAKWLGLDPAAEIGDHALAQQYWETFVGTSIHAPSRKGAYALAAAMGHRSPETAMRSYLHVLDLALGASLERIAPRLTIEQQAVLLGVSFDHWRTSRKRAQPPMTGDELVHAARWAALRAQPKFGEKIPEEMPIRRPDGLPPLPTRPRPSLGELYFILSRAEQYDQKNGGSLMSTARQVASIVRRSPSEVVGWLRKARQLAKIEGPRGAKRSIRTRPHHDNPEYPRDRARPGWTPAPPRIPALMREAERVYAKLRALFEDHEQKVLIRTGMWQVLSLGATLESYFMAPDAESAKTLVEFVNAIGIAKHRIEAEVVKGRSGVKSANAKDWREYLGIRKVTVKNAGAASSSETQRAEGDPAVKAPSAPRGVIIRIQKPDDYVVPETLERQPEYAIQGVRYAVFMAAVVNGLTSPTEAKN